MKSKDKFKKRIELKFSFIYSIKNLTPDSYKKTLKHSFSSSEMPQRVELKDLLKASRVEVLTVGHPRGDPSLGE